MHIEDTAKVEYLCREIVTDNIKKLGIDAVNLMADDLRKSGHWEQADLVDALIEEYKP